MAIKMPSTRCPVGETAPAGASVSEPAVRPSQTTEPYGVDMVGLLAGQVGRVTGGIAI